MARAKRKSKPAVIYDVHEIFGGEAKIFKVDASGDVWQFRMWIAEEKKYVRKSLKTRDLKTAIERGKTLYLEMYSDVRTGKKIFGITVGELVEQYLEWRREDASTGRITAERVGTIRAHLKHFVDYKGHSLKLCELDRQSLYDFASYRKLKNPTCHDVTIVNEQSTINHMMKFAFRRGLAHFDGFEFRKLNVNKDDVIRRDTFSLEEYDKLVKFLRTYTSKKASESDEVRNERLIVRDCILIAANTMMRVGELWQMRWSDIERYETVQDADGEKRLLVSILVRAEISKTRKTRRVIARGGEYFQRLKERSVGVGPDDFVFGPISGRTTKANEKRYAHWKAIMAGMGIDYKARNLTWYSLRHFGITCRIRAGVRLSEIATIAGTSTTYIDKHYGHIDDQMLKSAAMQTFKISKEGVIIFKSS